MWQPVRMGAKYWQFQKDVGWGSYKIPLPWRLCKWLGTCPIPLVWGASATLSRLIWCIKYTREPHSLTGGGMVGTEPCNWTSV